MADNKEELLCPACGGKMTKIFVPEYNHYVDICLEGCGGIYFDNRELEHFDEQHESINEIYKIIKDKEFKKVEDDHKRKCPVCGAMMVQNSTSANKTITIDCCYNCGGKFLDHGELEAMRQEYATEEERSEAFNKHFGAIHAINFEITIQEAKKTKKSRNITVFISRSISVIMIICAVALFFILFKK